MIELQNPYSGTGSVSALKYTPYTMSTVGDKFIAFPLVKTTSPMPLIWLKIVSEII